MSKRVLFVFLIILSLILFSVTLFLLFNYFQNRNNIAQIDSFEECVDAGYPVMESYPEQCAVPGGKTYVREITYYGDSTKYPCEIDEDCITAGCNSEICAGRDEETMVSICLAPEEPLPKDLGYQCGCFQSQCQWSRE